LLKKGLGRGKKGRVLRERRIAAGGEKGSPFPAKLGGTLPVSPQTSALLGGLRGDGRGGVVGQWGGGNFKKTHFLGANGATLGVLVIIAREPRGSEGRKDTHTEQSKEKKSADHLRQVVAIFEGHKSPRLRKRERGKEERFM